MYILGHIGFTAAAARAVDRERDLRLPVLLSILPDLIDKPAGILLSSLVHGNTRNFGHSFLGSAVVLAILLAGRRRFGNPLLLWGCYAGHFLLDRMWVNNDPVILFWPFLGDFPVCTHDGPGTPYLREYNIMGEVLGFGLLLYLSMRRFRTTRSPRSPSGAY